MAELYIPTEEEIIAEIDRKIELFEKSQFQNTTVKARIHELRLRRCEIIGLFKIDKTKNIQTKKLLEVKNDQI